MFFFLSKTLGLLILPLPLLILSLVLVLIFYRRRWARRLLLIVLVPLTLLSTRFVANVLLTELEVPLVDRNRLKTDYDAVVVLTGMTNLRASQNEPIEFEEAVDRILSAIQFINLGKAQNLIISGGSGNLFNQNDKEAPRLQRFAMAMGIEEEHIFVEDTSRNTYENAKNTTQLVHLHGFDSLLLITSAFHMRRALACFEKQDLEPDIFPVDFRSYRQFYPADLIPSSAALSDVRIVIKEVLGLIAYKLRGYI